MSVSVDEWLKNSILGLIILGIVGNYIVVLLSKRGEKLSVTLSRRLLTPYAIHRAALKEHHDVSGMPLSIYISWHLARLIAYSSVAALGYIVAFIVALSSEILFFNFRIPASYVAVGAGIAATIYNFQALSAFLSLRLLYIREVDPLVQALSDEEKAQAYYDPDAMLNRRSPKL